MESFIQYNDISPFGQEIINDEDMDFVENKLDIKTLNEEPPSNVTSETTNTFQKDEQGNTIRIETTISYNAQGQKVKTVRRYKQLRHRIIKRFGDAEKGNGRSVTIRAPDPVQIMSPQEHAADLLKTNQPTKPELATESSKPSKYVPIHLRVGAAASAATPSMPTSPKEEKSSTGKYVAPKSRDTYSLRLTNLSPQVRDKDITHLLKSFGPVHRFHLAKQENYETKQLEAVGYAFIDFCRKSDAEIAVSKLDGHLFAHTVIRAEWAKPRGNKR